MEKVPELKPHPVTVVDYDPQWPIIYAAEQVLLLSRTGSHFTELEHIGSTAVPGQRAKPIIDMMAAIHSLDELSAFQPGLEFLGYGLFDTGMCNRYFFRRQDASGQVFHLHIVELSTWSERKERLLRDYLLEHPEAVKAYGEVKTELAQTHPEDSHAYTEAKTDFIQSVINKARAERGLPPIDVWE